MDNETPSNPTDYFNGFNGSLPKATVGIILDTPDGPNAFFRSHSGALTPQTFREGTWAAIVREHPQGSRVLYIGDAQSPPPARMDVVRVLQRP